MREWGLAIEGGVLLGCLFGLLIIGLVAVGVLCHDALKAWREAFRSKGARLIALCMVAMAVMYGGSKGIVSVDDPYIVNTGSYATNDILHVDIARRFDFIPMDMEILIWSRQDGLTNASDWVQLVRVEEGPFKLNEFPLDIPFPNATNYNFMVAANYVPPPTVHTNGVWSIKGFYIPGTKRAGFTNTRIIKKEEQ